MTTKEFIVTQTMSADTKYIEFVKRTTFEHIDKLLATKGGEYSSKTNRFENFNDAGRTEDMPPEQALWYMMLKHFISVRKFVMELVTPQRRSLEKWNDKIDDIITYLILLKAMIRRRTHIEQVVEANELKKIAGQKEAEADKAFIESDDQEAVRKLSEANPGQHQDI
jgi:hypothetical protein